jgi:hypothetical protein
MGWDFIPIVVLSLDASTNPLCFLRLYNPDCGTTYRFVVPCLPRAVLASMDSAMHRSVPQSVPAHHSSYWGKVGPESDAGIPHAENDGKPF